LAREQSGLERGQGPPVASRPVLYAPVHKATARTSCCEEPQRWSRSYLGQLALATRVRWAGRLLHEALGVPPRVACARIAVAPRLSSFLGGGALV
jgi:hypothetical protein